jgi:hypothetical protein
MLLVTQRSVSRGLSDRTGSQMAKKKDRAFFVCPRWKEIADLQEIAPPGVATLVRVHEKTLVAIREGRPLARSTLRKALLAVRHVSGLLFDVDAYIVDQRSVSPR